MTLRTTIRIWAMMLAVCHAMSYVVFGLRAQFHLPSDPDYSRLFLSSLLSLIACGVFAVLAVLLEERPKR